MSIATDDGERDALRAEGAAPARHQPPTELTGRSRWACWRSRTKRCRDRYGDGTRAAERVVYEALHPTTGRGLSSSRPEDWVRYDLATCPGGRKPFGGVAFLVRHEDGLAVLRHAPADALDRLGGSVVHAEQEVNGDGIVVIVRAGVRGARTDLVVPLSGRSPYQGPGAGLCPDASGDVSGPNSDAGRLSGRSPYQASVPVRTEPVPEAEGCPDGARTIFSYSLKSNYQEVEKEPIRTEIEEYARVICEQGKAREPSKWIYGLIGVFKRHKLVVQSIPLHLLLIFAAAIGEDVGAVHRRVLAGWSSWKPHKVPLADVLRAVHADPSLLNDLAPVLADQPTLLAAAMCRFMGASGQPFVLPGRVLAEVLGLRAQQEGSEVVRALVELGLIRRVKEGKYADKLAAEYVLVGAGPPPAPTPTPTPTLQPRRPSPSCRPGHAHEQTAEFRLKSKLGGYLTDEHYLAEMMLARRLAQQGRELFDGFWERPDLGPEYGRQVAAARPLLKSYSITAVCRALRSKGGAWVYSLAAPQLVGVVEDEQVKFDRHQARLERQQEECVASPAPAISKPEAPRPAFISRQTTLQKLRGL